MSDNDTNSFPVSISADLSEGGNEILKQTPKGASKIWRSLFGAKAANREREVLLIEAQTAKDCADVMVGLKEYRDGVLSDIEPPECLTSYDAILEQEKREEQENLAENVRIALEDLSETPDEDMSDEELDKGFFARWRREAKVISEKDLQEMWGRVLAEEVKKPESISFRSLSTISNLSQREASLINKIAPYCSGREFFWTATTEKDWHGITFQEVSALLEAGIILKTDLILPFVISEEKTDNVGVSRRMFRSLGLEVKHHTNLDIPVCSLTKTGYELVCIAQKNITAEDYAEDIGLYCIDNLSAIAFKSTVCKATINVHELEPKEGGIFDIKGMLYAASASRKF